MAQTPHVDRVVVDDGRFEAEPDPPLAMLLGSLRRALPLGRPAAPGAAWGVRGASSHPEELHVSLQPVEDSLFLLTLNRPTAKNAIGRQLLRQLQEALRSLEKERGTRAVVLHSAVSGMFCAGADLKERRGMSRDEAKLFVRDLRAAFSQLEALPAPTIAAIDGFALGGGAELALACDLRVAGPTAQIAFPETGLGIIPGAGGTQRLPRVVGVPRAKDLIFTARRVAAPEALAMGLVDRVAGEGQTALEAALGLAREIARGGPEALRKAKVAVGVGAEMDLASGMRLEEACYDFILTTEDRVEGLRAFAEKRTPVYKGE
ncbi:enoyl-CoA hydratase/isomerase [Helicosporidium sp. ATCC 50920]|nr:enoyl-CoA hydratase/isomerase [Helicosporidium sp. ATCC 50920]|eukprot:KDD74494.1 enoyl-CoA hydratase/isomerase [Helicosporidium sp. ATCC 50920]